MQSKNLLRIIVNKGYYYAIWKGKAPLTKIQFTFLWEWIKIKDNKKIQKLSDHDRKLLFAFRELVSIGKGKFKI
jgi:hypothetical protein